MLSHRPDLRATMAANRFRVVIYKHDGCRGPFQTPELRDELPLGSCTGTQGTATIRWIRNRFTGEVLLIIDVVGVAPAVRPPYCNFVLIHEFAHMVHYALAIEPALSGNRPLFDSPFDSRLRGLYNAAISAGLYHGAYASTNYKEYWAESVTYWFLPDMLTAEVRTPATVSVLADYDPAGAGLVAEIFRAPTLPACVPVFLRVRGTVTGPDSQPLAGITVSADLRLRTASGRPGDRSASAHPHHRSRWRLPALHKQALLWTPSAEGCVNRPEKTTSTLLPPRRRPSPMGPPHRLPRRLPCPRRPGPEHRPPKRRPIPHPPIRPHRHLPPTRPKLHLDPQTRLLTPPTNVAIVPPAAAHRRPFSASLRVRTPSRTKEVSFAPLRVKKLRGSKRRVHPFPNPCPPWTIPIRDPLTPSRTKEVSFALLRVLRGSKSPSPCPSVERPNVPLPSDDVE